MSKPTAFSLVMSAFSLVASIQPGNVKTNSIH